LSFDNFLKGLHGRREAASVSGVAGRGDNGAAARIAGVAVLVSLLWLSCSAGTSPGKEATN